MRDKSLDGMTNLSDVRMCVVKLEVSSEVEMPRKSQTWKMTKFTLCYSSYYPWVGIWITSLVPVLCGSCS